ncbi:MAG: hypothetical protein EXS63_09605 [Candidatus Omnitrophica bacterium]|nr:hypothetical protein [Candidatus Omnitrophota bacterium]
MDLVLNRVSNPPHQAQAPQQRPDQRPVHHQNHGHSQPPMENRRERTMYQVVCADCRKNCEVPFKPTEERPVYCKECFALRKSGHAQKPAGNIPSPARFQPQAAPSSSGNVAVLKSAKPKKKKK